MVTRRGKPRQSLRRRGRLRAAADDVALRPRAFSSQPFSGTELGLHPSSNDMSRAEWQYLLACARNWVADPHSTRAVGAPNAALDWTLVVEGATVHGLISAVRRQFEIAGGGAV